MNPKIILLIPKKQFFIYLIMSGNMTSLLFL
mgnify:CR=1 FL=1|jgi:hypothetical protein